MTKKNIVVISMDEVRPDRLSCYGYKRISTPAIDQVAKEGVRFETCITSSGFTLLNRVPSGKFNRVKMNIANQLFNIHIFLTHNRFACPACPVGRNCRTGVKCLCI